MWLPLVQWLSYNAGKYSRKFGCVYVMMISYRLSKGNCFHKLSTHHRLKKCECRVSWNSFLRSVPYQHMLIFIIKESENPFSISIKLFILLIKNNLFIYLFGNADILQFHFAHSQTAIINVFFFYSTMWQLFFQK